MSARTDRSKAPGRCRSASFEPDDARLARVQRVSEQDLTFELT